MISLKGARLNNLRNVDAEFPERKITVVCGPSGSGKSSLALDTLHGECSRRYLETLSPFAQRVLGGRKFIPLDDASGLVPSVAIQAVRGEAPPKSDALSLAGADDSFRLLWSTLAKAVCPECGAVAEAFAREEIVKQLASLPERSRLQFLAPVEAPGKSLSELSAVFLAQGFSRAMVDGASCSLADLTAEEGKAVPKKFEIVADRIVVRAGVRTRIAEAVDACLKLSRNYLEVDLEGKRLKFPTAPRCPNGHASPIPRLAPKLFSSYSTLGACPTCHGTGLSPADEGGDLPCSSCLGLKLGKAELASRIGDLSYADLLSKPFTAFHELCSGLFAEGLPETLKRTAETLLSRTRAILDLGIGYLSPSRPGPTLSGGEQQRLRLAAAVSGYLDGILFCLDEPASGLGKGDAIKLFKVLEKIRDRGNTIVLMEHNPEILSRADWILEMGPGPGELGGQILLQGPRDEVLSNPASPTGRWLRELGKAVPKKESFQGLPSIEVVNFSRFDIRPITVSFPVGKFSVLTGDSGSGKSTLMFGHLLPEFKRGSYAKLGLKEVSVLGSGNFAGSRRSTVASAIQILAPLRDLFAGLPESKLRGYQPGKFSLHAPGGRCETCKGEGVIPAPGGFEEVECPVCEGRRFRDEVLEVRFKALSIADILDLPVERALSLFEAFPKFFPKLRPLAKTGLGYLRLGQTTAGLSSGERARIRLSLSLMRQNPPATLYLFDEPARGLHQADAALILDLIRELTRKGHTVIAIEHSEAFIRAADKVVELRR